MARDLNVRLLGDEKDLQRAFAASAAESKLWGDELERSGRKAQIAGGQHDELTKKVDKTGLSFRRASGDGSLFARTVNLIKPAGLITGLGLAAEGASALGGGAVAATGALAPLAGALAAYPALGSAAGQGLGVFKLAIAGIDDAVGGLGETMHSNDKAFKALSPEAQDFARVLNGLKPTVRDLQQTAQKGFFPGAERGLKALTADVPIIKDAIAGTSKVIGDLADDAGRRLASAPWQRDLETQSRRNEVSLDRLGHAGMNVADVVRDITIEVGPLVSWLTKLALGWSESAKNATENARETGKLRDFFGETRDTMESTISISEHLAKALWEIVKAGKPLGDDVLHDLDQSAARFEKWTKSAEGQNQIAKYFEDIKPPLYEAAGLIHDLTTMSFRLGQGDHVAPLIRDVREELLPVLEQVVQNTTEAFGPHLIDLLVNVAKLFGDVAGSSGPLTSFVDLMSDGAEATHELLQDVPGLKTIVVSLAGAAGVLKALDLVGKVTGVNRLASAFGGLADQEQRAAKWAAVQTATDIPAGPLAPSGGMPVTGRGRGGGVPVPRVPSGRASVSAYQDALGNLPPAMANSSYGRSYALDQARQAGGAQNTAARAARVPTADLRAMEKQGEEAGTSWRKGFKSKLAGMGAKGSRGGAGMGGAGALGALGEFAIPITLAVVSMSISGDIEKQIDQLNTGSDKADGMLKTVGKLVLDVLVPIRGIYEYAKWGLTGIAHATGLVDEKIKGVLQDTPRLADSLQLAQLRDPKGFRAFSNNLTSLKSDTFTNLHQIRQAVDQNVDFIHAKFKDGSAASKAEMSKNLGAAVKSVRGLMRDGTISVDEGTTEMTRLIKAHSGAGREAMASAYRGMIRDVKKQMAAGQVATGDGLREIRKLMKQYLQDFGYTGRQADLYLQNRNPNTGGPDEGNAPINHKAGGGWIGARGMVSDDIVPIGNNTVAALGEAYLDGPTPAVANRHQTPWIDQALGFAKAAGVSPYGNLDELFTGVRTPHYLAGGGFVRVPGDPNTTGGRDRVNPAIVGQVAPWIRRYHANIGYAYDPGGGHKSPGHNKTGTATDVYPVSGDWDLLEKGLRVLVAAGKTVYYGTNGVGIPLAGHGRGNHAHIEWGTGGAVHGVVAAKIARQVLRGPDSPLKRMIQRGLDGARSAAQARVDAAGGSFGDTGDLAGGPTGGKAGTYSFQELRQLWIQAGGPPGAATIMAHVALAESTGNPKAHNRSGASGLWQILGLPFPGDPFDPLTNARMAVAKYRAGGLGPWEASRRAWGRYVSTGVGRQRGGFVRPRVRMHTGRPVRTGGRSPNVHSQGVPNHAHSTPLTPSTGGRSTPGAGMEIDGSVAITAGGLGYTPPEPMTLLDYIDENEALAALTEDLTDDIGAADQRVQYYQALLEQATDPKAKSEAARNLKSAQDARKSLTDGPAAIDQYQQALSDIDLQNKAGILTDKQASAARQDVFTKALAGGFGGLSDREKWQVMADQNDALKANTEALQQQSQAMQSLADEMKRDNDIRQHVVSITSAEAQRWMADQMIQSVGGRIQARRRTPGGGGVSATPSIVRSA
jgi:hypothetical protein